MKIHDWMILTAIIVLVLVTGLSLMNIFKFMPLEKKCDSGFKIINECGCYPDKGLATLFNGSYFNLNETDYTFK